MRVRTTLTNIAMPTTVPVTVVNAFVDGHEGGNPAGVVLDAEAFTADQKLAIARRVGLSETVFVSASTLADFKLEFFTPARQIAHCGHATIATFSLLREQGRIGNGPSSKETIDGVRRIEIDGDLAFMEQRAPEYTELSTEHQDSALAALGLDRGALASGLVPCIVNTGNPFLLIPLADEERLGGVAPDFPAIERMSEVLDLVGYYPFARLSSSIRRQARTRMFAPRYGIREEAATGTAAGPLACYLHDRAAEPMTTLHIEQGQWMSVPSPSILTVRLEVQRNQVVRLFVGGRARIRETVPVSVD